MNRAMICAWMGVPDEPWPPEPYALLGLTPGECNAARIEKRVQERMATLRCYQLSHPAEATEGMNRVAQAFIYLIEHHCPHSGPVPGKLDAAPAIPAEPAKAVPAHATAPQANLGDTAVAQKTRLDWQAVPPPVRTAKKTPLPAVPVDIPEPPVREAAASVPGLTPAEAEEQAARNLAEYSEEARSGLVTLPAVMQRADLTRQLLIAWRKLGRYLGNPRRKVTRVVDQKNFSTQLDNLLEVAERYPAFLGHPGRPGYRAVALAHLGISPEVFNAMGEDSREQLARDWGFAHRILLAHRVFLLRQFKALRRRSFVGRVKHALKISFDDHPVLWTGFGAALAVALCALVASQVLHLFRG